MRRTISFNKGWRYSFHNVDSHHCPFYNPDYDDSTWETVDLPHDSSILGEFAQDNPSGPRGGYAPCFKSFYSKDLDLTDQDCTREIFLEFDGVYMNSNVYVNGKFVGNYPYGYTTFRYRLNPFVHPGKNKISVEADNEKQPGSRWYTGTGIYRPVRLIFLEKDHFAADSFVITTPIAEKDQALVRVEAVLENNLETAVFGTVSAEILDEAGSLIGKAARSRAAAAGSTRKFTLEIPVENPRRWSHDAPSLYTLVLRYTRDGAVIDEEVKKFGIRKIEFTHDRGFVINGKQEFLKGVCLHHDNGCLGAIADEDAMRRKIEAVRAMGANAIRTSHNPTSPQFLALCDEYGMYVMEELFDEWIWPKRPGVFGRGDRTRVRIFAYADYFRDWAEKDTQAMICRDRSHPSIVLWSIGNEIDEMKCVEGEQITNRLVNTVHRFDETRPVTAGCLGMRDNPCLCSDMLDVCGYNYSEIMYESDHEKYPDRVIVGSENATVTAFEPRGCYENFLRCGQSEGVDTEESDDPEHQKNLDRSKTYIRARIDRGERSWKLHRDNPFVGGMFLWTGVDYLGEPTPEVWPSVSSYFGAIDRCLLPKDAFYYYQSVWTDQDVLHILPHWTLPGHEGEQIPVWCFTNCDQVELFVNGKSYGKQQLDQKEHFHLEWQNVVYEPGEVTAIGWRGGRKVTAAHRTAGEPAAIALTLDRQQIGKDRLVYCTAKLLDRQGNLCPREGAEVSFCADGNLRRLGVDNGSPLFSKFQGDTVPFCGGYARAVFRGVEAGTGWITASLTGTQTQDRACITVE